MPTNPIPAQPLPYPGDPGYPGTRRKQYRPTHPATAEAEFAPHDPSPRLPFRRGTPSTSAQKMQRHTYPEFGRSSPEAGAVAAQRAAAGQGQGIVPGPHISEVPPMSLEDIIKMLTSGSRGPVTRKPMQGPRTMTPPVRMGPSPPSMGIPSPERGNEIQGLTPLGAAGGALGSGAPDLAEIMRRITGAQQTRP